MSDDFSRLRQQAGLSKQEAAARTGYSLRTIYRWENGWTTPRRAAVECLTAIVREKRRSVGAFSFIDLFAGIGGMRRGFEAVGGRCVFSSEWNRFCHKTYLANFDCDHEIAGDITAIPAAGIPEHDLLLAGFPCQPFSIAGVSKKNALGMAHGFRCDVQGTLFFDVARIIDHHRPRAFLLENVKNLLGHDRGRTFEVIRRTLTEELGYRISWRVMDARCYVPQHRERIFIAGFRDGAGCILDDLELPDADAGPTLVAVLHPEDGSGEPEPGYTDGRGRALAKYTLSDHLWRYLRDYADKHRRRGNGFGYGLCGSDDISRTLSARYYKDGSEILVRQPDRAPRRLTPRECARLMGFDAPNGPRFRIPVSDTQAYRQFGNAVVVPVVEAVARHMAPWLDDRAGSERRTFPGQTADQVSSGKAA